MKPAMVLVRCLVVGALSGCTQEPPDYDPKVSAADFVRDVTNPFFPLSPGTEWRYEEGEETVEVRVLEERRDVMGVSAVVVRDTVKVAGALKEDTYDWYAQDKAGNVWYLGEDTKEYDGGKVVSTEGSWEWGKGGALPGIGMKAEPRPNGTPYFQEFYWGEAVDEAEVIDEGRHVVVPFGTFDDTITTKEWTRLEPDVLEFKHYARGVGLVKEEGRDNATLSELVAFRPGT